MLSVVFFQAEDGIRDLVRSRGLGDVYKRQMHRALEELLQPATVTGVTALPVISKPSFDQWFEERSAQLDRALLSTMNGLSGKDASLFSGDRLRFPKMPKEDADDSEETRDLAVRTYRILPLSLIHISEPTRPY